MDTSKLSEMVRTKRAASGLRAAELGPSTLSHIENGTVPDTEMLLLLSEWLEMLPAEFLPGAAWMLGTAGTISV